MKRSKSKILVISDNDGLSRAIALNLNTVSNLDVTRLAPGSEEARASMAENGDFDLIILGLSSRASEPIVTLARASLCGRIGKVPLLVISERPFASEPERQILRIDFPFDVRRLQQAVRQILESAPATLQVSSLD